MASVSEVRNALAAQLQSQTGLTVRPRMPDQVNPPMAAILPGLPYARYGITMGDSLAALAHAVPAPVELNFVIAVFVSRAPSIERAQEQVDQYLGLEPSDTVVSIPLALNHDPTLGGLVEWCEALQVQAYGDVEVAGQMYFQGRVTVNVSVTQDLA